MTVFERIEELAEEWMVDRRAKGVGFEVAFGDVRLVASAPDQDAIPRGIFGRTALGDFVVPRIAEREDGIDVDHYPAVVEELVVHDLADAVLGFDDDHGFERSLALGIVPVQLDRNRQARPRGGDGANELHFQEGIDRLRDDDESSHYPEGVMVHTATNDLMNELLNGELRAAHLYWQASAWCAEQKLEGGSAFLGAHAQEEITHMERILAYMIDNDLSVAFSALPAPAIEANSVLELFQAIYEHEQKVTDAVGRAVRQVQELADHATFEFLQWFVLEQRLEMKTFRAIVDRIELIGDGPQALYMIDRELAERAIAPTTEAPVP